MAICCLLLGLFCCGPRSYDPRLEETSALLHTRILTRKYGELSGIFYRDYLGYLEQRLSQASNRADPSAVSSYKFVLLNAAEPFAFSAGGGIVLVSKGLVLSLKSEAELAFVLAHELAHQTLGHTANYQQEPDYDELVPDLGLNSWQKEAESEADLHALGIIALAGYDPRVAINALVNAYRLIGERGETETHPKLSARISAIRAAIEESEWTPPGTIDRRAFQRFRRTLLHS